MNFREFPKMSRFSRDIIITEKIDGTNASIFIQNKTLENPEDVHEITATVGEYTVRAGSRTRWITPTNDNFGFANWVSKNAEELVKLGEGHHFGEWWGQGIQRGYGLKEKRFSLFNVERWNDNSVRPSCCLVVPTLYKGVFNTQEIQDQLDILKYSGSVAAPDYKNAEGVVIYHTAGNVAFKKTLLNDEVPKSLVK